MSKQSGKVTLRSIDKAVIAIMGLVLLSYGLYIIGPWYLTTIDNSRSPLTVLFEGTIAVKLYGWFLLIDSIGLLYGIRAHPARSAILSYSLLSAFLLRMYALTGTLLLLPSWRPLSWAAGLALVAVLGSYYIWIRISERTTE